MAVGADNAGFMAAVGMFDGVHRGHVYFLNCLKESAAKAGLKPKVFTFRNHPLAMLRPERTPALLTDADTRRRLIIEICGIADVEILDFDKNDLAMTAGEFCATLARNHGVKALMMGFNNHIGSDRLTAAELGAFFPVEAAKPCPFVEVSSSAIRAALAEGDVTKARLLLGHSFSVCGTVVAGRRIGRTIGFPTANVSTKPGMILPADGVYAVDVAIDGKTYRGVANIGKRPTVGGHHRTLEVHIVNFSGDIYGATVEVIFLGRLRDEKRFGSLEELASQLEKDKLSAVSF